MSGVPLLPRRQPKPFGIEIVVLVLGFVACARSADEPLEAATAGRRGQTDSAHVMARSATGPGTASASATAAALADSGRGCADAAGRWRGSYSSRPAAVSLPSGLPAAERPSPGDDRTATGPGRIEIEIDDRGEVTGHGDGALGLQTIRGQVDRGLVRAGLAPLDPDAPVAMTGVLFGRVAPQSIRAELRVSDHEGRATRTAFVVLERE